MSCTRSGRSSPGSVTAEDERLLASCYRSCLALAEENGVESLAFCCISTGVFHFPNQRAAEIAVQTVRQYQGCHRQPDEGDLQCFQGPGPGDLRADCSGKLERLREALRAADAVVVGAGAGLSAAAGFTYSGERFRREFLGFCSKIRLSRYVFRRLLPLSKPRRNPGRTGAGISSSTAIRTRRSRCMTRFWRCCGARTILSSPRTWITASRRPGFDKKRLFYTQGDYGLFQCSAPVPAGDV